MLRNLSFTTDRETLKTAYYSLFQSHITYGLECWGGSCDAGRVFKLQKRAVRALAGIWDQRVSCRPLFEELDILPLPALYILGVAIHAHGQAPIRNRQVHNHDTRGRERCHLEGVRLASTFKQAAG